MTIHIPARNKQAMIQWLSKVGSDEVAWWTDSDTLKGKCNNPAEGRVLGIEVTVSGVGVYWSERGWKVEPSLFSAALKSAQGDATLIFSEQSVEVMVGEKKGRFKLSVGEAFWSSGDMVKREHSFLFPRYAKLSALTQTGAALMAGRVPEMSYADGRVWAKAGRGNFAVLDAGALGGPEFSMSTPAWNLVQWLQGIGPVQIEYGEVDGATSFLLEFSTLSPSESGQWARLSVIQSCKGPLIKETAWKLLEMERTTSIKLDKDQWISAFESLLPFCTKDVDGHMVQGGRITLQPGSDMFHVKLSAGSGLGFSEVEVECDTEPFTNLLEATMVLPGMEVIRGLKMGDSISFIPSAAGLVFAMRFDSEDGKEVQLTACLQESG